MKIERDFWPLMKADSLKGVCDFLHHASELPRSMCRGMSNLEWSSLTTTVDRALERSGFDYKKRLQWEYGSVHKFLQESRSEIPAVDWMMMQQHLLGVLSQMQHLGVPTRLLDWTLSPWIAAYFACSQSPETDGVVFVANANVFTDCSNRGRKSEHIDLITDKNKGIDLDGLLQWSCESDPFITTVHMPRESRRFAAQQGWHTIMNRPGYPHDYAMQELMPPKSYWRIGIPKSLKRPMLGQLERMNISARTLFPGIEGVAFELRDTFQMLTAIEGSASRDKYLSTLQEPPDANRWVHVAD